MPEAKKSSLQAQIDLVEAELNSRREQLKLKYRLFIEQTREKLKSVTTVKNVANAIFIITISSICFQQCYSQVNEYLKYSVKYQVSHTFPNSTLYLIPGITICNNNRLRMSKLIESNSKLKDAIVDYMSQQNMPPMSILSMNASQRMQRDHELREIIESKINVTSLMIESPISKLLELSSGSIIKDVDCNGLWGRQFNCENFRIIESYQGSACYTMFYVGTILEALTNKLAFDFNTTLLGGKKRIQQFDEQELAELVIDFEPYEHADFQRDVGAELVIHSTSHVGSIRDMSHSIQPGRSYEIILARKTTKRLPPPYKSMCFDYRVLNSNKFTNNYKAYPSIIMDTKTCNRNCILKMATKYCNCWPVEIPYYPGDPLIEGAGNYRVCQWVWEDIHQNHTEFLYINCYKKYHVECRNKCRRGCMTEDYNIDLMSKPWPTKEMFLRTNYEFEKNELRRLRNCCARISLKYLEYMETRQIMYPSVTLAQLVGNIGGIVSGLVGVSAITLYRYFAQNVLKCTSVKD